MLHHADHDVQIVRVAELPLEHLADLIADSERDGFRFLTRLRDEWLGGTNRFDRPGEALFLARAADRAVGVCGLNRDPYASQPNLGRVRHLYVASDWRRRGIGGRLMAEVIRASGGWFDWLRLRTNNPEAARFYETLGFHQCAGEAECTHALALKGIA